MSKLIKNKTSWFGRFAVLVALITGAIPALPTQADVTMQAQAMPAGCATPPASGLVGYWHGDGNADDSACGNNGTLVGNAAYITGKVGAGFSLDGNGDEVSLGNPTELQLNTFTFSAWIKRTSGSQISLVGPNAVILGYGQNGYAFFIDSAGNHLRLTSPAPRRSDSPLCLPRSATSFDLYSRLP